jgi:hypothetical protein
MTRIFLIGIMLLSLLTTASALTGVSSCRTLNVYGETYRLSKDITDFDGDLDDPCFDITNNYVTFDLYGYDIDAWEETNPRTYAIRINHGSSPRDIIIKNSRSGDSEILNFKYGIYMNNCAYCEIRGDSGEIKVDYPKDSSESYGLYITDSDVIVDNVWVVATINGIYLYKSHGSIIKDSTIRTTGEISGASPLHIKYTRDAEVIDSYIRGWAYSSLIISDGSDDTTITNSEITTPTTDYAESIFDMVKVVGSDDVTFDKTYFYQRVKSTYNHVLLSGTSENTKFENCEWRTSVSERMIRDDTNSDVQQYGILIDKTHGSILWNDTTLFNGGYLGRIIGSITLDNWRSPDIAPISANNITIDYGALGTRFNDKDVYFTLKGTPASGLVAPVMTLNGELCDFETSPYCINTTPLTAASVTFYSNPTGSSDLTYALAEDPCEPDWQNTSWTSWRSNTACLTNDSYQEVRNLTESDANDCPGSGDKIYYEYKWEVCDYCTPSTAYTTWTDWDATTQCYENNTQNESRSRVEYDENFCYDQTGLPADEYENVTHYETRWGACSYLYGITINHIINSLIDASSYLFNVTTASEAYRCTLYLNSTPYINDTPGTEFTWQINDLYGNYTASYTCCYDET